MLNPFRLLALTFFADPSFDQQVKDGSVTSLPSIGNIPGIFGQPQLPANFISEGLSNPGTWPSLPSFNIPPSIFSWVGDNHQYPQTPAKDPFYDPPRSTYENLNNGDVIAIRPVGLDAVFPELSRAYQISYRSESATGNATVDVTTVMIPKNYDGKHVVSWQDWEDSNNLKCAPSYLFEAGLRDPTVDLMLLQGWALNVPDHEGLSSAFAVGYKSGKATLDSIRALKNAASQINLSYEDVGLYGYSGGSIATGFAIELQPTYAPDVQIKAASMGGVVASLNTTFYTINKGIFAGFAFGGLYGLATGYGVYDILEENLKADSRARANEVLDHCFTWDLLNYIGENVFDYTTLGAQAVNVPAIQYALEREHMGFAVPKVPIFIHQGASDEIAPVGKVDDLVDFYCQNGVHVIYERDNGVGHILEMVVGVANVIQYFQKVFNDDYVPPSCSNYQQAISNDHLDQASPDNKQALDRAILGDYSGYGLQNVAAF
ncbi:Lipase A [Wickerhamiella sorbophila]|uniref:Lipase A n=1 Tax=Wickerhamiella sorbophila TaxID=45607 RepID=A0A2T0FD14_9ASCO|nr:Lipase A [Wickerhamiella sorbophila]PRT52903.1 Lipase A [Wickerhamiella sorbophila]